MTGATSTVGGQPHTARGVTSGRPRHIRFVVCALALNTFMSMLDQSIVATAGPTVVGELGGLSSYAWIFTAYMLAFSVCMPLYGKLGDLCGRKPAHLVAIILFLSGSVTCGLAQSMGQLIAFRVLQGIGGGGLVVLGMATLGDLFEPRQRARYQGYFAIVFAVANLSGPLLGGLVADQLGWRWAFFINLPLGLATLTLLATFLRTVRSGVRPPVDFAGAITLSGAVTAALLAVGVGGVHVAWNSHLVVSLVAVAAALFAVWLLVERTAADPLLPLRLFRNRTFAICAALAFLSSLAFFGCLGFLPLFLQLASGVSPTQTGLLYLPAMICVTAASVLAGMVIGATGRYKWLFVASMGIAAVGMGLLSTVDSSAAVVLPATYAAVVGFGIGLSQQVTTLVAQHAAPARDLGTATSTVAFLRNMGVPFGTALYGALLNGRLAEEIAHRVPPGAISDLGRLTPESIAAIPVAVRSGVAEAYGNALAGAFRWMVPVLLVALVLALLMRDTRLPRRGSHGGAQEQAASFPAGAAMAPRQTPASLE